MAKIRTDFVTNSSSSSYIICFARIADEEKAKRIIEKHNLDVNVFDKDGVEKEMLDTFQLSPQIANSSALHYSPSVVVNNQINMKQDPLGQMVRDIKTFSGGSKNDYNYGMGV